MKLKKILTPLFIFLILFCLNFLQKELRNFSLKVSSPFLRFFWQKGKKISSLFKTPLRSKILERELEALRIENQKLLAEIAGLRELKTENEILREALNLGIQEDFELILADVLSKDPFEDSILINAGSKDGVSKDLPVITQQKIILGKVSQVFKNFSEVSLISNREMSFSAKIQEKEVKGIMKGKGNFKLSLELVPKNKNIEKGDLVVTDIFGGVFPEGLLVGKIQDFESLDIEPFQKGYVLPLFDLEKIEKVFLIKKW